MSSLREVRFYSEGSNVPLLWRLRHDVMHGVGAETANHWAANDATHWVAILVLICLMCQALDYTSGGFYYGMFSSTDPSKSAAVSRSMLSDVEAPSMR